MRRIILGDTHGRNLWKSIVNKEKWDELIFIGDYFDTHEDTTPLEQMNNFDEICAFKRQSEKSVIMLIGNHDHHYFKDVGNTGTSGYQHIAAKNIELSLEAGRDLLQMAYQFDNFLCSHAGIGETWLKKHGWDGEENIADFVNEVWKEDPHAFIFDGYYSPSGDDVCQTPIWIRPISLMKDSQEIKKKGIIQIVGHTTISKIDIDGKSTGGKYFFIDTLGTSGEYLIIDNNKLEVGVI